VNELLKNFRLPERSFVPARMLVCGCTCLEIPSGMFVSLARYFCSTHSATTGSIRPGWLGPSSTFRRFEYGRG